MKIFQLVWLELGQRKTQLMSGILAIALGIAVIVAIRSISLVSEKAVAINLDNLGGNQALQTLNQQQLCDILDEQGIADAEARSSSMQVLMSSQELISTLAIKIQLLENIETYLQDWLWGLTYQFIQQGNDEGSEDFKDELQ